MNKCLLSILCLVCFFVANAEQVAFVADGASYEGTAFKVSVANGSAGNIVGLSFGNDDVKITHKKNNSNKSNVTSSAVRWYQGDVFMVTPTNGITITKIEVCIASGSKGAFTANIGSVSGTGTSVGSFVSWEGNSSEAFDLTATKQVRFSYMVITYSKSVATQTNTPIITPNGGEITSDTEISIACTTEGASIYYTIDGTKPSASSTLYEGPFTLSKECTVKAIAIAKDLEASAITEAIFTLIDKDIKVATFDFTTPASLNPAQETPAPGKNININDIVFSSNAVTLVCAKNGATTNCRIWGKSEGTDLRTYKNSTITISANNANITSIEFVGSKVDNTYYTVDSGEMTVKVWTATEEVSSVVFSTIENAYINTITITYNTNYNYIESIEAENETFATYYNLQGVKVDSPTNGIYIKVQGSKASKIYAK
ncbi:MAG: chitobiase/beta-hexosaminidase C-terminal domain-containing protein [Muribaculaceae bacterium]|nr:chitobiase/beta-hexosaminidase C-terminal domain-containing protein [Muribaculaceae bacterium]